MRVIVGACLALLVAGTASPAYSDSEIPCPTQNACPEPVGTVSSTGHGYRYVYSGGNFYQVPVNGKAPKEEKSTAQERPKEYFYQPACSGNSPASAIGQGIGGDIMCTGAAATCPAGQLHAFVYWRYVGDATVPKFDGDACVSPQSVISAADVVANARQSLVDYLREKNLDSPSVSVQPRDAGVINIPAIAYTHDPGVQTLQIAQPFPSTLTATPHFVWSFGDGAAEGSYPDSPGSPYDGVDPAVHPAHYVAHAYATPGGKTVTCTVHWTATLQVDALGVAIPVDPVDLTATAPLQVHEAVSHLVSG
jgi:hypothetical protein